MTRKGWMQKHHPEKVDALVLGGIIGCPHNYDDLPDNTVKRENRIGGYCMEEHNCEECWNKEMEVDK